jgi:hypothetical protein
MIALTELTDKITIKLDGSVANEQMQCIATWKDHRLLPVVILNVYIPDKAVGVTNDTTEVDLITAPAPDFKRTVDFISIYNTNSTEHILTILFRTNTSSTIIWRGELDAGERVQYTNENGFMAFDNEGAIKYATG